MFPTLQQPYDSIREMVKLKTGRAMQEKDVEYTDRKGRVRVRKGCSPIRESVVNIREDISLDDLLRYTQKVESRWGIKAIQIHLHKDEGHYENPEDKDTWKPNYHAHIIWDWMDHETGKSRKLDASDMSEMQDMVAETLDMERGMRKSETGLDHLERNDYIIRKQEKERQRLEAEKKRALEEKDKAEDEALKAMGEKDEAEKKAREARAELADMESQSSQKKAEVEQLDRRIEGTQAMYSSLIADASNMRKEVYSLKLEKNDWKDHALLAISGYLLSLDRRLGYCIGAIQDYAYSGTGGRGGRHGAIFDDSEASVIKDLMAGLADMAGCALQKIADWLVWLAQTVSPNGFNEWELRRASREVRDIADGRYDWRIEQYGRDNGLSR